MNEHRRKVILLADNNYEYRHSLRNFLELDNFKVEEVDSPQAALEKLEELSIDIVLADLRLEDDNDGSDISGLKVARQANLLNIPCIIVTGFPSVEATRLALRARGISPLAEDFVPKSSGPEALLDAIRAVLENADDSKDAQEEKARVMTPTSGLMIDLEQRLVSLGDKYLDLSRNQYNLLAFLYQKQGVVCSPEEILEAVYGDQLSHTQATNDKRLERLLERVRQKIEPNPSQPQFLIREHGRGYRLVLETTSTTSP